MKKLIFLSLFILIVSCSEEIKCDETEFVTVCCKCPDANYIKNSKSPYVLPWEIGKKFKIGQGNCTEGSHSTGGYAQFAYDFDMPIGTNIVAIRSGVVESLEEGNTDNEQPSTDASKNNYIIIEHDDGTRAVYAHLTFDGALKEIGDTVDRGEVIALSGDTGWSSGPHLHIALNQRNETIETKDGITTTSWFYESIPLSFKNTEELCFGLSDILMLDSYLAVPY
jgi:murein DD-endopeptidase MepM/ murein hydrolase activator NlpD